MSRPCRGDRRGTSDLRGQRAGTSAFLATSRRQRGDGHYQLSVSRRALFKSIVDATHFAAKPDNRKAIAEAIAPKNYLNQPVVVVEQVLTGRYADGLGNIKEVPDRIGFEPFPWHSMAIWILTQMKRWKHIDGDVDYKKVAEQVYLASECDKISRDLGYAAHDRTSTTHTIMGEVFDPDQPEAYVQSFAIQS